MQESLVDNFKDILTEYCVVCPEAGFIYFRIPKVAGTSIHRSYLSNYYNLITQKYNYLQWEEWRNKITFKEFKRYYKFAFVRNPYDRFVSLYCYFTSYAIGNQYLADRWQYGVPTLREFAMNFEEICRDREDIARHAVEQHPFTHYKGKRFCDFIGKFESLKEDFKSLCDILDFPPSKLPHAQKTAHAHYSLYYDKQIRDKVEKIYRKDIDLYEYEFVEL